MSAGRVPLITPDDLKQTGGAPAKVDAWARSRAAEEYPG